MWHSHALQELAARQIAAVCNASDDKSPKIIVEKSTVPVKTADAMAQVMAASCQGTNFQAITTLHARCACHLCGKPASLGLASIGRG